ncbi:DUF305 domain-containing protein [Nocardioides sp. Bht2]|uniref:DUF305 domain-containing protein n=1 Tax=Nocardioides sp. Bht2 TaxID=3392297 RepID=UPI0039B414EF
MIARRLRASVLATVVALALTGCGDDADGESTRTPEQAEVGFATDLLQHDAQVLALLDLARERILPAEVTTVLSEVQLHRATEVEALTTLLAELSAPTPATVRDHANVGHSEDGPHAADTETGGDLPGMPDADELNELTAADDGEFARLLAELLGELNDGAVEIADDYRGELADGDGAELADEVAAQREAEEKLLDQLSA